MRATLWQGSGEASAIVREVLRGIFKLAGIDFRTVDTREELLATAAQARRASDRDILIIDCFHGEPDDIDRCLPIVTQTRLSVYIVHPRQEAIHMLEEIAGRPLTWLPADATITILLDLLHALRALVTVCATAPARPSLTKREREVAELVAAGESNAEIGAALHITEDTVRTHLRALLRKFGVTSRAIFIAVYRS